MKAKFLVTGFQPFAGEALNPSALLLQELVKAAVEVDTVLLPVSYQNAFPSLLKKWHQDGPYDQLLMLGQAGGRNSICLERFAVNWSETPQPDEDGFVHPTGPIADAAPGSYVADFFPSEWITELGKIGPTTISFSAGTYVCNSLFYQARHQLRPSSQILFVHVPYLPEQIVGKSPTPPSVDLNIQFKIVQELIRLMKSI